MRSSRQEKGLYSRTNPDNGSAATSWLFVLRRTSCILYLVSCIVYRVSCIVYRVSCIACRMPFVVLVMDHRSSYTGGSCGGCGEQGCARHTAIMDPPTRCRIDTMPSVHERPGLNCARTSCVVVHEPKAQCDTDGLVGKDTLSPISGSRTGYQSSRATLECLCAGVARNASSRPWGQPARDRTFNIPEHPHDSAASAPRSLFLCFFGRLQGQSPGRPVSVMSRSTRARR